MESGEWLVLGLSGYMAGGFALHRHRLHRLAEEGLEWPLLLRIDPARVPPQAQDAWAAVERAKQAWVRRDSSAAELHAAAALSEIAHAGGVAAHPAFAFLDAHVRVAYLTGPLNLELVCFWVLQRLKGAIGRFGPQPELFHARAMAWARLGQLPQALDELGRSVFYAQRDPFYVGLVLESRYVAVARPRLHAQCKELRGQAGMKAPGPDLG
jgi:hypothetical protein